MFSSRIRGLVRHQWAGLLALFVALGGTAYATHPGGADTVNSADIINSQVKAADIGTEAVRTAELGDGEVQSADVANDSLTSADIGPNAVGTSEIQTNGVGPSELQVNSVSSDELVEITEVARNVGVPENTSRAASVDCPSNTDVISGGASTSGITLVTSDRNGNGWFASARNDTGTDEVLKVSAYCMEP